MARGVSEFYLQADEKMILGQFIQEGAFVNVFPESESDTDELGSCVLVTSKHVMLIKQRYKYCIILLMHIDCL